MKNIYFITSELAGDRAGSFRQERWINAFLTKHDSVCVTVINIINTTSIETLKFFTQEELKVYRSTVLSQCKARSGVRQGLVSKLLRFIKHFFLLDFFYPSSFYSYKKLIELGVGNQDCIVFISSPPFSLSIISYILKKKNKKLKYVVDMRDAWALHPSIGGIKFLKKAIEKKVLKNASMTITVSKWLSNEFADNYFIDAKVAYNVPTHYLDNKTKTIDWHTISPSIDKSRLKIVYTGSTPEGHFDLIAFIEGINMLSKKRVKEIQFIFIGECLNLQNLVESKPNLLKYFVFINQVTNLTVRTIQENADVLLFLGYNADGNAGVVSTKLYEYLYLKKPILPIGIRENSDVAFLLRKYTGQSRCLLSPKEISDYISESLPQYFIADMPKLKTSRHFFVESLYKDYLDTLDLVLEL